MVLGFPTSQEILVNGNLSSHWKLTRWCQQEQQRWVHLQQLRYFLGAELVDFVPRISAEPANRRALNPHEDSAEGTAKQLCRVNVTFSAGPSVLLPLELAGKREGKSIQPFGYFIFSTLPIFLTAPHKVPSPFYFFHFQFTHQTQWLPHAWPLALSSAALSPPRLEM